MADRYHHGDLPNALRAAAADLIAEKGPAGFSLREVARRAGVSHAAPAHHFGDATGLLTALAVEAFQRLHGAISAAADGVTDPAERLRLVGRAYVEVAHRYPAHCAVVFRSDLVDTDDPAYREWGDRAFGALEDTLVALRDAENPDLDVDEAARLCWSAMQGLVVLYPSIASLDAQRERVTPPIGEMAEAFSCLMLDGLRNSRTAAT